MLDTTTLAVAAAGEVAAGAVLGVGSVCLFFPSEVLGFGVVGEEGLVSGVGMVSVVGAVWGTVMLCDWLVCGAYALYGRCW